MSTVVRIHFVDNSAKATAISPNTTAADLREKAIDRIGLKEDACFALFEKRDDWERCLEPDDKPADLMAQWEKSDKKKEGECQFVFKKKIFLKDDDREMEDPVAKVRMDKQLLSAVSKLLDNQDLVYKQALQCVINSTYPCNVDDAIKLAGLQCIVTYGDFNKEIHHLGFLTNNLKEFVPKSLFGQKKSAEWEHLILEAHKANANKPSETAKTEYLSIVRCWPYYGTTFFPPCKSVGNKSLPSKVIIGVNYEGIRLLKPKNKELISEHLFTEICSWASSSGTFAFEFGNQNESQKYTFETKQGAIIAATIQTYIDILVQMLKNGDEDDEEESETGTTISQSSD